VREEEARAQEEAARSAAAKAQEAGRETEALQLALREAELNKLRLAAAPSLRALLLVSAARVPLAVQFARAGLPSGSPLRQDDRTWWRLLHVLEADGLTPSLKGTDVGNALFAALDSQGSGAVACADAGYLVALLCSGTERSRVDASCDCPGAPAGGPMVTQPQVAEQLELCARVRGHCVPLLLAAEAASGEATASAPPSVASGLRDKVAAFFGSAQLSGAQVRAEAFRSWAASDPTVSTLFLPLPGR